MMASIRTVFQDAQYFDHDNTPSFLTTTTFSLGTADVTNFHVGRRIKLYDTNVLYGTINSVSATHVSVRLDSGQLTVSLSSVALAVLSNQNHALPQAAHRRNMIINSGMDIWQRGASFEPANNVATYTADRFAWVQSAACAVNVSRAELSATSINAPSVLQSGALLSNSLRVSVSAVDTALAAGEYALISYRMEGYDWRQIAHRPNVLSFWARTNRSGIYYAALRNNPVSASFVQAFTISSGAINTWNWFSIPIPEAPQTDITWNYAHSLGCEVTWCLGAGSGLQGGAGNWTATNIVAGPSQVNFVASAENVFMLTGIQLEEGLTATPLEQFHYSENLQRCLRYYWRGLPALALNFPSYTAGTVMSWPVKFPASMRITPTVALSVPGITLTGLLGNPSVSHPTLDGCRLIASANGAQTNANFVFGGADFVEANSEF